MNKFKLVTVLLSGLSVTGLMSSCSSSPLQDVTGSLPKAFEGVTNNGYGNSDAVIALDAAMPEVPATVRIFQVKGIDERYAKDTARKFSLEDDPVPLVGGERRVYSFANDRAVLEVQLNGRLHYYLRNGPSSLPESLPTQEKCVDIAEDWLQSHGLYPENVAGVQTGVRESMGEGAKGQPAEMHPLSYRVSFTTSLDSIELDDCSVVIGDKGEILELYVNRPITSEYGTARLKTPDAAFEIIKGYLTDPSFNSPLSDECMVNWLGFQSLKIDRVSLRYSWMDIPAYLMPVYVFEGEVIVSPNDPGPEHFVGRVDAVQR